MINLEDFQKLDLRVAQNRFLTNSFIFFTGSFLVGLGSYFFHFLMARLLTIEDYGEVQSLIAILGFFTIPLAALSTVLVRDVASFNGSDQSSQKIQGILSYFTGKVLMLSVIVVALFLLMSRSIAAFLNLSSVWPVIILGFSFFPVFLSSVNNGVIQGLEKFKSISLISLVEIFFKITVAFLLVAWGFKTAGAIFGLLAAGLIGYLISFLPLRSLKGKTGEKINPDGISGYFFSVLLTLLAMNLLFSLDLVLVKHFFPPAMAGQYGGLSLIGRIIFFLIGPIASVMFPMITRTRNSHGEPKSVFTQAIALTLLAGGLPLVLYSLFPDFVIKLLIGSKFLSVSGLLGWFGLAMLLYGLINLFVQHFLSLGQKTFLFFLGGGVLLELVLISVWHQGPGQIVAIINLVMSAVLVSLAALCFKRQDIQTT